MTAPSDRPNGPEELLRCTRELDAKNYGEALREARLLAQEPAHRVEGLYHAALSLLGLGYPREAIDSLLAAKRSDGLSAEQRGRIAYALGRVYEQAGKRKEAAKEYDEASRFLHPGP